MGLGGRAAAFGRLEAVRMLRSRGTALGTVIFVLAHAVGRWQQAGGDALFLTTFMVSFALAFSPGLSADRDLSFDRLIVLNLLSPWEYAAGKWAGMLAWSAGFVAMCWTAAVVLSMGDVRFATWYAALAFLIALAAFPVVIAADLLLGVRLPAAVAFIVGVVGLFVVAALGVEPPTILRALGLQVTPYSYVSLSPLLLRALLGLALTPVIMAAAVAARGYRPSPG